MTREYQDAKCLSSQGVFHGLTGLVADPVKGNTI